MYWFVFTGVVWWKMTHSMYSLIEQCFTTGGACDQPAVVRMKTRAGMWYLMHSMNKHKIFYQENSVILNRLNCAGQESITSEMSSSYEL